RAARPCAHPEAVARRARDRVHPPGSPAILGIGPSAVRGGTRGAQRAVKAGRERRAAESLKGSVDGEFTWPIVTPKYALQMWLAPRARNFTEVSPPCSTRD